jgi:hypothetical protein
LCKETSKIGIAEYQWKKEPDEVNKDRTKDLHPSIKNMIENASAMELDKPGELCENSSLSTTAKRMGGLISNCTNF